MIAVESRSESINSVARTDSAQPAGTSQSVVYVGAALVAAESLERVGGRSSVGEEASQQPVPIADSCVYDGPPPDAQLPIAHLIEEHHRAEHRESGDGERDQELDQRDAAPITGSHRCCPVDRASCEATGGVVSVAEIVTSNRSWPAGTTSIHHPRTTDRPAMAASSVPSDNHKAVELIGCALRLGPRHRARVACFESSAGAAW